MKEGNSMKTIDAHIHFNGDHPDAITMLEKLDLRLLNVCVAHDSQNTWHTERKVQYRELAAKYPDRCAWCTAMDVPRFDDPGYADALIKDLDKDFEHGAVACKVWKNLGMVIKKPSGEFFHVDDPLLDPVYAHMEKIGMPLLMHIAEPKACWLPLDENNTYRHYYTNHPEYHMYNKPEYPSHEEQMQARDNVAEKYPGLKVIGAHMASLAHDVSELAKRFDTYSNLAVDLSGPARWTELAHQDADTVREFFIKYQDRFMHGTDRGCKSLKDMSDEERKSSLQELKDVTETALKYFGSDDKLMLKGSEVQGLGLPGDVMEKIFFSNALKWYPALTWE